jgi:branched-chain amino acid transport system ATP-binding protein
MESILDVRHIVKAFGGVRAVNDISFSLYPGQLLAVIGPNGAGKTTCFNMINGQIMPDSGTITILGDNTTGRKPRHVWHLGVGRTFQITAIFPSMTVLENIQIGMASRGGCTGRIVGRLRNRYSDQARKLLQLVDMSELENRICGELAYGDLKRVELALALSNEPRLLLMDEPTAGMGPIESAQLMQLIGRIVREQRVGALFTEHDMDIVFNHADQVIVLEQGRMIATGTPEKIRKHPGVQQVYLGTKMAFQESP